MAEVLSSAVEKLPTQQSVVHKAKHTLHKAIPHLDKPVKMLTGKTCHELSQGVKEAAKAGVVQGEQARAVKLGNRHKHTQTTVKEPVAMTASKAELKSEPVQKANQEPVMLQPIMLQPVASSQRTDTRTRLLPPVFDATLTSVAPVTAKTGQQEVVLTSKMVMLQPLHVATKDEAPAAPVATVLTSTPSAPAHEVHDLYWLLNMPRDQDVNLPDLALAVFALLQTVARNRFGSRMAVMNRARESVQRLADQPSLMSKRAMNLVKSVQARFKSHDFLFLSWELTHAWVQDAWSWMMNLYMIQLSLSITQRVVLSPMRFGRDLVLSAAGGAWRMATAPSRFAYRLTNRATKVGFKSAQWVIRHRRRISNRAIQQVQGALEKANSVVKKGAGLIESIESVQILSLTGMASLPLKMGIRSAKTVVRTSYSFLPSGVKKRLDSGIDLFMNPSQLTESFQQIEG
eukprot:GILJ01017869.1.p1 GENE.GILJ01017869.1~~GILJ01017869.1.p1  ORF type:complete len:516 (+),score=103.75 GILJ01017869.1:175-1548(+)